MAGPDLSRLTCLVVDDSAFMRSMLTACLNALGVGKLKIAEDGGDAIQFLKLQKLEPMKAGMLAVDMIISNWQMSPVDGMILLRWVRRHAESPNRFVPFVMLSAYSSAAAITEARDAGATEFITKPFSVAMLAAKIQTVIERPRQFVHTATYFGPDRRRHEEVFFDDERRKLTDKSEGVEVIHG